MMDWMVTANVEKYGCIYENDDIIVEHQMLNYDSGDREAFAGTSVKGWINVRAETRATLLSGNES